LDLKTVANCPLEQRALDTRDGFGRTQPPTAGKLRVLMPPSVDCGLGNIEQVRNLPAGHSASTRSPCDACERGIIFGLTTAASIADSPFIIERRASFALFRQAVIRLVHQRTLTQRLAVCRR
jgi:hypothetical protein